MALTTQTFKLPETLRCMIREMAEGSTADPDTILAGAVSYAFFEPNEQRQASLFVRGMLFGLRLAPCEIITEAKRLYEGDGPGWLCRLDVSIVEWIKAYALVENEVAF